MIRKIYSLFVLSILIGHLTKAFGYPWPVPGTTTQHQINATVGEWRPTGQNRPTRESRFHRGVDIQANAKANV